MKSSLASRRTALAAALVIAVAAVSAGCASGGASSTPAPAATGTGTPAATAAATPSRIPLATAQPDGGQPSLSPSILACLKAHGVPVTSMSTDKQVRQAFVALPLTSQERVFTACEHLFPPAVRQTIADDLAQEKAMTK